MNIKYIMRIRENNRQIDYCNLLRELDGGDLDQMTFALYIE